MDVTYLGHASFKIRGTSAAVVTDPYDSQMVGLKFPKHVTADIVTVSHDHDDHNAVTCVEGSPFIISGPGEYEIKGISIVGISVFHDDRNGTLRGSNTVYRIEVDGISVVHAGDLGHTLTAEQIESLDGVDILLIPVGGYYTIDPASATRVVHEVEPSIVIPMHYGRKDLSQKAFGTLAPVSAFLKEMGKEGIVPVPKLSVTKEKLPEELQVVVLE